MVRCRSVPHTSLSSLTVIGVITASSRTLDTTSNQTVIFNHHFTTSAFILLTFFLYCSSLWIVHSFIIKLLRFPPFEFFFFLAFLVFGKTKLISIFFPITIAVRKQASKGNFLERRGDKNLLWYPCWKKNIRIWYFLNDLLQKSHKDCI